METEMLAKIPGAEKVLDWFGCWPSFHDAEVTRLELNRNGTSFLQVHAFRMTSTLDPEGYYILDKHAIVTIHFGRVLSLSLGDFNGQNVLAGLEITETGGGYALVLEPCYGLTGQITAASLTLDLSPGMPDDSIYKGDS